LSDVELSQQTDNWGEAKRGFRQKKATDQLRKAIEKNTTAATKGGKIMIALTIVIAILTFVLAWQGHQH
jgi:hypothetical protein